MNDNITQNIKTKKNTVGINEIYTFFIMVSPVLFIYGTGLGSITLSDMILLILNILLLFKGLMSGKMNIFLNLIPFFIYIVVVTLLNELDFDVWLRTLRYLFYLINIIFFAKAHFNFDFGIKVYKVMSLVSTGFLFFQVLIYRLLGIYIPGVILSANLMASDLYEYNRVFQQAQFKRFMSFFEEPSHYAIYILGYITILLFLKMNCGRFTKKEIFEFCFLSGGIALSTSILGVIVLGGMFSIWIGTNLFKNKKSFTKFISFLFVFIIAVILISKTTAFEYFTDSSIVSRQANGRFDGYALIHEWSTDIVINVFGRGMERLGFGIYLASYPLMIYYFGFIGLALFILAFIPFFIRRKINISVALLICLFSISLGSEILLGRYILVFLPLVITGNRQKEHLII